MAGFEMSTEDLLLNNLAVALANQGQVEEALATFQEITDPGDELRPNLLATEGPLRFRMGELTAGRLLYLEAAEDARRRGDRRRTALALAHLAREEVRAGTERASDLIGAASDASAGLDLPEIPHMLDILIAAMHGRREGLVDELRAECCTGNAGHHQVTAGVRLCRFRRVFS
jgi:hypothetical protein